MTKTQLPIIAEITMGQSPPGETYNTDGIGLPFFQGKAEFGEESPAAVKWCSAPQRIAEPGDILLSVRAPVGPTNISSVRCCIGRGLAAIRARKNLAITRYLFYFFKMFENEIAGKGVGSTFKAINRSDVERLELSVPTLSEQMRIVKILDQSRVLQRFRQQADRRTADLIPAIFHDMFGDPATNPKGWPEIPIGQITSLVTSGITPRGGSQVYLSHGPYFLRSQNVQMNRLDLTDVACLPLDIHKQMNRTKVHARDVLLNITGASIGRITWIDALDREANVNQHVCIIRLLPDLAVPEYLSVLLSTSTMRAVIQRTQSGASRQGLNHEQIRKFPVVLPPIRLQREFANRIKRIKEMETKQIDSRCRLDDLFQSLLHRAFEGES